MPFILQTATRADMVRPWPVRVLEDGAVTHGRPDAHHLLGFQRDAAVQTVDVFTHDVIGTGPDDVPDVRGMFPVYSAADGSGIFVVLEPVESLEPVTA